MPQRSSKRKVKSKPRKSRGPLTPTKPLAAARLPSGQKFLLKYSEFVSLNPSASGANSLYQFRANDLYDPNFTGTGHQPRGFDQLMTWYNHFTVVSSRFRVTISQPTLTSTGNQFAAVCLTGASSDVTTTTSLDELFETKQTKLWDWGFIGTANYSKSLAFTSKWIRFNSKEFFGKKPDVLYADFQGNASNSPVELAFFNLIVGSWDASADTDSVRCLIEIEFDSLFSEPKPLPSS